MEKRNGYKAKSVAQPVMGIDRALIVDAETKHKQYMASLKTLARQVKCALHGHEAIEYRKTEHGNITIK